MLPWLEHPAARAELIGAVKWYEGRQPGLGERLNSYLMSHLELVREWPDSAPLHRGRQRIPVIRRKGVRVFPYGIIYFVSDDKLIVVAYAHDKRSPGYWQERLQDL